MRAIYIGDHTVLATTKLNAKIYVDSRDTSIAPHLMMEGDWEPWVTNCMVVFLQRHKGCLFIDVGANVGWYTLLAAHFAAQHVYTIEPNPRMVELLRKTIAVNGLRGRVTLVEAACGAEPGKAHLKIDWNEVGGASLSTYVMADGSYSRVTEPLCEVVRLDDVVKARHMSKDKKLVQTIIKIDVEGFEPHVLAGAQEILVFRPILFLEHARDDAHTEMLRGLQEQNYDLRHVQHTGHPSKILSLDEAAALTPAETILCVPKGTDV